MMKNAEHLNKIRLRFHFSMKALIAIQVLLVGVYLFGHLPIPVLLFFGLVVFVSILQIVLLFFLFNNIQSSHHIFQGITLSQQDVEHAKDDFLSIASHQLRTPLGSIRWNVEMIKDGDFGRLTPEVVKVLDEILESIGRMIELVNGLLSVSRIDQKKLQDNPQEVSVLDVINAAIKDFMVPIQEKKIRIETLSEKGKVPVAYVDTNLFREVMDNLLSNAIKYSPDKSEIKVTVKHVGNVLRVSVEDEGIGIPPKDQPLLFSKFFRAENAMLSETDGAGLGLFVIKSYVESWGGRVWCESPTFTRKEGDKAVPGGSVFHVELPIGPSSK